MCAAFRGNDAALRLIIRVIFKLLLEETGIYVSRLMRITRLMFKPVLEETRK